MRKSMERIMMLGGVLLALTLSSCQCAWQPDVGPVEDEEEAAATVQVEDASRRSA